MATLPEIVASALALIERRQGDVSSSEIAELFGVCERRARSYLKEATRKNLRTLCLEARLAPARGPVRETNQPIETLAIDFGYSSRGKFDRSYQNVFGMTPSADRRIVGNTKPDGHTIKEGALGASPGFFGLTPDAQALALLHELHAKFGPGYARDDRDRQFSQGLQFAKSLGDKGLWYK